KKSITLPTMAHKGNKGKKKITFNPEIPSFEGGEIWPPFLLPLRQKWKKNPPPLRPPTHLSDHEATPPPRYAITSQSRILAIIGAVDTSRRLETIQAI